MPGKRVDLLCEDRLTERFLRQLCKQYGVRVMDANVAPSGRGAASAWVVQQYPTSLRRLRARRHQQNLGLIIGIDGDNQGFEARKRELAAELERSGQRPRDDDESIAILVPTWSIETWLAYLVGEKELTEAQPLKQHAAYRSRWETGSNQAATITKAVEAWATAAPVAAFAAPARLPALVAAYLECERVGLG